MRGLLAIIVLAILTFLMSWIGFCSPVTKANQIEERINAAYAEEGIPATADMQGNVAVITGELLGTAQQSRAVQIADAARCDSCEGADQKWHEVKDTTTIAAQRAAALPTQSPYTFNARLDEDGSVTLNGYVPTEIVRERVLAEANLHFPGRVNDNKVKLALGAPNNDWGDVISLNLNELHLLDSGRLAMNDTDVLLSGRAATVAIRDEVNTIAEGVGSAYNQVLNIEVLGEDADNVGQMDSEDLCQGLLDDLNSENAILFAVNSAALKAGRPFEVLNSLSSALNQCPAFQVKVEGHTSTPGDDAYNMALSKQRAATVMQYMTSERSVSADRLSSEGYGETRLKISPEVTPADRAVNRRIEFIVSR